jgi:uncharacterized membrane protein
MFFGFIYGNGLVLFLGWNLILAGVAYFFSHLFTVLRKKKKHHALPMIVLLVFILFFPNTIYVLTDFIHLQNYHFFDTYPSVYTYITEDWVVFMMIAVGALLAAKLGIASLVKMKPYLYDVVKKYEYLFLGLLFIASSFGIYIGRFIRLNSWDILKLHTYIPLIFDRFDFFMSFMGIYIVLHIVVYFVMTNHEKSSYNRIESTLEE